MGLADYNTIWEIYNPTEETIDLTPYTMQRFDLKGSSYPSTPTYESKLTDSHLWSKTLHGAATTQLGPHKTILYWSGGTAFYSEVKERPGVVYIANFAIAGLFGENKRKNDYGQAFRVPQYSRHALAKNGKIVDNFFYGDGNTKYKIPAGNFMRKPGRNLPRTQMKIDIKNSDWVVRGKTAKEDLGYRYSYYYDRSRLLNTDYYGNRWLEDTQDKGTGSLSGNPIKNVDYTVDATRSTSDASTKGKYTPPTWCTKARAQAADK